MHNALLLKLQEFYFHALNREISYNFNNKILTTNINLYSYRGGSNLFL